MTIRKFVSLLLAFAPAAFAQQDLSAVEIKVVPVSGAIYMLEGAGGNIGVSVGDDGIVIIDDQYAPLAPKIKAALASISKAPVRFVLNTHYHGDHTGGNEAFGESAPIVAHENVRKRLAAGLDAPGMTIPTAPEGALPVVTFNDRVTLHVNGEDIRALHIPHAHTDGDAVVFFSKSNVVHMGDLFFNGRFPFVDIDGGGSVSGTIAGVEAVLPKIPAGAKIIAGHGPIGTPAELKAYAEALRGMRGAVEAALAAGKSPAQMKEEKVLDRWSSWSWNFINADRFIDILVRDIEGRSVPAKG
jgi:glyoxylase-like metal-dependent hydrolase (beta-lactamase superfamily II)